MDKKFKKKLKIDRAARYMGATQKKNSECYVKAVKLL